MLRVIPEICWHCGKSTTTGSALGGTLNIHPYTALGAIPFNSEIKMKWCSLDHFHSWLEAQSARISVANDEVGLEKVVDDVSSTKADVGYVCCLACTGLYVNHVCPGNPDAGCHGGEGCVSIQ